MSRADWSRLAAGVASAALIASVARPGFTTGAVHWLNPGALGSLALLPWLLGLQRASWLATLTRASCWACLALALARPELQRDRARVSLVAAADVSGSIGERALLRTRERLRELEHALPAGARLHLLSFARRPRSLARAAELERPSAAESGETDLQAVVREAYGLFDPEHVPVLLLISDGRETHGDLASEAERAAERGVRIDHLLVREPAEPADVAVRGLQLPRELAAGVPFVVRAQLAAERPTRVQARLFAETDPPKLEATRELTLPAGESEQEFPTKVDAPGRVEYRLELKSERPDRWPQNNQASAAAELPGAPRVLIVDSEPQLMAAMARDLRERGFAPEVLSPSAAGRAFQDLTDYAFVVLSDVPARELRRDALSELSRYVEELGGGLLVAGGTQGFGLGGYQGTALEQLLPVRMAGEEQREEATLALALIIDCSGSMTGAKLELARKASSLTAQALADPDLIEVIGFSSQPDRRVRLQAAANRAAIAQNIARLVASGGTQLYPALDAAHRDLRPAQARLKHAILLTDGQTQESGLEDLASSMRADGITLSTVGLGAEVNRALLETLAGLGGGRAYFPEDAGSVPQIFLSEARRYKRPSAIDRSTRVFEREHARFLEGIPLGTAPPLGGYVTTQAKARPAQIILETERGDPLLARWRAGLGYALAWTSDLKPRWASTWLTWRSFGRLLAQLVREHMRSSDLETLPLEASLEGERAHVVVDALGADDQFEDRLTGRVRLIAKAGEAADAELRQTAPGRYEAELALPGFGAFTLQGSHFRAGHQLASSRGRIARPYADEYAFSSAQPTLLARVSAATGGREVPAARAAFEPGARSVRLRAAAWPVFIWLALGLFLIDQCVRHTRVFGKTRGPDREGG
jgi:Ca-activated chloride channel family protein